MKYETVTLFLPSPIHFDGNKWIIELGMGIE
jgi:hypothetical protein